MRWECDSQYKEVYHILVKITLTYAADTRKLRIKTIKKLNSTEMDFLSGSTRISRRYTRSFGNTLIKQQRN